MSTPFLTAVCMHPGLLKGIFFLTRMGYCSTGWLTWWGQPIANSSVWDFLDTFDQILRYNNNMGSVTLYMATGGTNFGYTAGAPPEQAAALLEAGLQVLLCKL